MYFEQVNLKFFTGQGGGHGFEYADKAQAESRYQFLCWWIEFCQNYWTSDLKSHPVVFRDTIEYGLLNDYFKRTGERVFHPKDVFSVM